MKRIIIQLSELNKENWNSIYRLIEKCHNRGNFSEADFNKMKKNGLRIAVDENPTFGDIRSVDGYKDAQYEQLKNDDYVFNLIYVKTNKREEFSDLTRFFLLKKKYAKKLTLGINLDIYKNNNELLNYKFQLGIFFYFIRDKKPDLGNHSLYLINSEGPILKTNVIPYMNEEKEPNYENASPYIFPLIPINKSNFGIFETHDIPKDIRIKTYIENSIKNGQKKKELKNKHVDTSKCHTLFEEWFTISYIASGGKSKIATILSYCDSIRELVQNIIFHTREQQGLLYIVFNKKSKVSETLRDKIPEFDSYSEEHRFVEIGVFDYNEIGIVETYLTTNRYRNGSFAGDLELEDFFDPKKILPDNAEYFLARCAAHLGIKSFVSSVMYHKGYFRVESNNFKGFKSQIEYSELFKKKLPEINNIDGTHYEIILPPIGEGNLHDTTSIAIQTTSVSEVLKKRLNGDKTCLIKEVVFEAQTNSEIEIDKGKTSEVEDETKDLKQKQENAIKRLGEQLLNSVSPLLKEGSNKVAINMSKSNIDKTSVTFFLKLLAYIQPLQHKHGCLIFTQIEEELIVRLCQLLNAFINELTQKDQPIWSDDHPVVLIGTSGTTRILAGKTKNEMIYVNRGINLLYFTQSAFPENEDGDYIQPDKSRTDVLDRLIVPYDCLINSNEADLPTFISRVDNLLNKRIEDSEMGCKIEISTKIGNKLYIKNYYEADFLFQNNFFTDRFAYFIAKEIIAKINNKEASFAGKKLVLIGYNSYSAPLVERVKEYVNNYYANTITDIIIAKAKDREKGLDFKMSESQEEKFLTGQYGFLTIVPIASTLSTIDKIIALFTKEIDDYKRRSDRENTQYRHSKIKFIYNHVTILVRDKVQSQPTQSEIDWNWIENGMENNVIKTSYQGNSLNEEGIKVNFLIAKKSLWHELINEDEEDEEDEENIESKGTFPKDWQRETYINNTKNASLNTKEKLGIPVVSMPSVEEMMKELSLPKDTDYKLVKIEYYKNSILRLSEIRDFIYFGHINHNGSHHRYYFDIEQLFDSMIKDTQTNQNTYGELYSNSGMSDIFSGKKTKDENTHYPLLRQWKEYVNAQINRNALNVIISPDYDYESCYINAINKEVFGNNAFVIYLNINDSLHNNKIKLSYLKDSANLQKFQYYFVDQALLTGETYQKTRSCMASILDNSGFKFDGIITMVNRLSKDKYKEIQHGLNMGHIFSYLHFFVLPSKESEKNCNVCDLSELYRDLKYYSAFEDCREEIERNRQKFEIQEYSHYLDAKNFNKKKKPILKISDCPLAENGNEDNKERYWLRMIWKYRLFFELERLSEKEVTRKDISDCLNSLYSQEEDPGMNGKSYDKLGNKISFLKAIIFPPLSQYVKIRECAHFLHLNELHKLLEEKNPKLEDLDMLLVLLKHLAILGSNALVRKDVIISSWELYFKVYDKNYQDSKCLEVIKKKRFAQKFIFYIKLATYQDEAKSLWLGELLRKGEEMNAKDFSNSFKISETTIYNPLFQYFDKPQNRFRHDKKCFKEAFLPFLYYDNTAITRKTLDNLEYDLKKDSVLEELLFSDVSGNIAEIVKNYKKKIDHEYYYAWFRHFLDNENKTPDGINLLEKFIYVLYEKLLLANLVDSSIQNDKPFDQNAKHLLEVAIRVMDADAAFICVKEKSIPLSILAQHNIQTNENQIKNCYLNELLNEADCSKKGLPFVIRKDLSTIEEHHLGEGQFNRATYLMLNRARTSEIEDKNLAENSLIGIVTFLYDDKELRQIQEKKEKVQNEQEEEEVEKEIIDTHDRFMKNAQESGRLLLLLKPETDKYVKHVADEKQFEVWKEKQKFIAKYNAVFAQSRHAFGDLVVPDLCNLKSYENVPNTFYRHANNIITNLYAEYESNLTYRIHKKHLKDIYLSDILEKKFGELIMSFEKWVDDSRGGFPKRKPVFIYDKKIDPQKIKIRNTNKFILQSFIFMCLHNAFMHIRSPKKTVMVWISEDTKGLFIEIKNDFPEMQEKEFFDKKNEFDNIYHPKIGSWEKVFENFGEGITLCSLKKTYPLSDFEFIPEKKRGKTVYCFRTRIYLTVIHERNKNQQLNTIKLIKNEKNSINY